jgi:LacI family transcriptional regulator
MRGSIRDPQQAENMTRVTLKQVSQLAGVGTTTASLVLRDSPTIPEETKQRVRDAMAELGYVYNRGAAMFRHQKSMAIGLVVTEMTNPYFAQLAMALEQRMFTAGYTLLVCYSRDDTARQETQIRRLLERGVDGIAMLPAGDTDPRELDKLLAGAGVPLVLVARHLRGEHDYVGVNNNRAGQILGKHLVSIGAKTFALLGGPGKSSAADERIQGLQEAIEDTETTMLAHEPYISATTAAAGAEVTARLLDEGELPDAVIAYSDVIAAGVYAELHERGLRPGRDIAVASFDDIPGSDHQVPPLTTVATFGAECGDLCADLLLQRIDDDGGAPGRHLLVEPKLRIRASTVSWSHR